MKHVNAFTDEIYAIDYSYFWSKMEVLTSIEERRVSTGENSWQIEHDWQTATFVPFADTEIGATYSKLYCNRKDPSGPSPNLIQYAATDLLTLSKEKIQLQVNRLHNFINFLLGHDEVGIHIKDSILESTILNIEGIELSKFAMLMHGNGFKNQNLPSENNKIYLRANFRNSFRWYVYFKIDAIQRLINETGITPDQWVTHDSSKYESTFVEAQTNILNNDIPSDFSISTKDTTPLLSNLRLSLRQIALLYIYQGKSISRGKMADTIAKEYGKKSGERLYSQYTKFSQNSKRTNIDGRMIKPFIADIEKVIPHLSDQQRQNAETELKTISAKL